MSDTISRQAAIDAALLFMVEYCGAAFDEDMQTKMKQRLEGLPPAQPEITQEDVELYCRRRCLTLITDELYNEMKIRWLAQPEPKKGKWINRSLNIVYPEWERYKCSACGGFSYRYDFCPHCGADMRGEE